MRINKSLKLFLNGLKCPLCKSPVDISSDKKYNFACASDFNHYRVSIPISNFYDQDLPPFIQEEIVIMNDGKVQYGIQQKHICMHGESETSILIKKIDAEGRIVEPYIKKFESNKILFNFQEVKKDKLINKVKMYLTFM